jgi:hypothetical protein
LHTVRTYGFRFLVVLAVLTALTVALAPSTGGTASGPYLSALSNQAFAAGPPHNCPNNICNPGGPKTCKSSHGFYCTVVDTTCTNSKCL